MCINGCWIEIEFSNVNLTYATIAKEKPKLQNYLMKFKKPFNKVEEILQDIPTWRFVGAFVFGFACLALWVAKDIDLKSPRDVARELFQNSESIAIVAAVVLYFKEIPDRKTQKHYDAWQVIDNAAVATQVSGGVFIALREHLRTYYRRRESTIRNTNAIPLQ